MAPELTSVTVRIYGWDYTLKVESTEVERAKQLADYLDQRMQQVAKKSGTADTLKIAIRSAITIIDELFGAKDELKNFQDHPPLPVEPEIPADWKHKVDELTNRIEKELQVL